MGPEVASPAWRPVPLLLDRVTDSTPSSDLTTCAPPRPIRTLQEKERQRLENLRRKEEAEQLRRQKVEEDKRRRLEEVKMKREERLRKVLRARERVEQMQEEKKKQIEQKFAQIDEKTEKVRAWTGGPGSSDLAQGSRPDPSGNRRFVTTPIPISCLLHGPWSSL
ncbi:hypothetical protein P7K49_021691 [Saguinus oedipus]|uniref:Uncharacterized protein n=1 Tax=Saguinus oedipus TaxID=9490 RepID=A0ABQ9UV45_SAGOE|nr:hypothetical protein P7K49_021691 [Saguinus oedipus]